MSDPDLTPSQSAALKLLRQHGTIYVGNRTTTTGGIFGGAVLMHAGTAAALVARGLARFDLGPDGRVVKLGGKPDAGPERLRDLFPIKGR